MNFKTAAELITPEVQERIDQMNMGLVSVTEFVTCLLELDVHVSVMNDSYFVLMSESQSDLMDPIEDIWPPRYHISRP